MPASPALSHRKVDRPLAQSRFVLVVPGAKRPRLTLLRRGLLLTITWCPQGSAFHIPVIRAASEARTVDLPLQPPSGGAPPRDLAAITSIADLPACIAEVVRAVAEGVQTTREFARTRGISISNASERFRAGRRLGWIVPVDGRYLPRQGIRYRLDPARPKSPS